jgi:transcriptional regulator with XRE-family HTH domain
LLNLIIREVFISLVSFELLIINKGIKKMDYKLISRRVKEIRTDILKMSQREFAEALGIQSRSAVSMWENEESEKCPSKKMSLEIARLSNVSVSYVFGESDEKDPNVTAKDELEDLMSQIRTKNPEKQKELLEIIRNLVKISGD